MRLRPAILLSAVLAISLACGLDVDVSSDAELLVGELDGAAARIDDAATQLDARLASSSPARRRRPGRERGPGR